MTDRAQNPWLPELYSLFEDVKKIAPGPAIDIIGCVRFVDVERDFT